MFEISQKIREISSIAEKEIESFLNLADEISFYNQEKVQNAFYDCRVSESHFVSTTGYGYGDRGRETLDEVFAKIFKAESGLVRHNFVSGTHTLSVMLFALLRSGDTLLAVTGTPYDTLLGVIGVRESEGSLKEYGVNYKKVDFKDDKPDYEQIKKVLSEDKTVKVVAIQRSRGYGDRFTIDIDTIEKICSAVRSVRDDVIITVDNCYGEFTEKREPIEVGADVVAGSLIKNAGGGRARTGGYIVGKADLVEKCAYRLTCPGIGRECGATLGQNIYMYEGIFSAPHVTAQAMKTAIFASYLFEKLGFEVSPRYNEKRSDIVQTVTLGSAEGLTAFCGGVQKGSPIDSFVVPEGWDMPGYDSKVIMAAGAFVQGASIELSADGPMREPFKAYIQGGLTYESGKLGIILAAEELYKKGLVKL